MIKSIFYCFLIFVLGGILSCNDPQFIDTNLVDVDLLDIVVDDDFDISAFTLREDSVLSFTSGVVSALYPFGIGEDPVFGRTTASTIFQPFLTTTSPPSFEGAVVDSVILEIILSPDTPTYGDTTGILGIEVFEVTDNLDVGSAFFSNLDVQTVPTPIGMYEGVPNFRDSMATFRIINDTIFTDTFPAHLRIPLDIDYGERIINAGDDILGSFTDFIENFNGLQLRPTNVNDGLIAFDLSNFVSSRSNSVPGATVMIFFTIDGIQDQFNLVSNLGASVRVAQVEQDFDGSMVGDFLGDTSLGDSLIFAQGLVGANAVVRLDDIDRLFDAVDMEGVLVNGAILEVYGTALNDDEELRPVATQLELRSFQNGELELIRDFQSAQLAGSLAFSGGDPEDMGGGIYKYTFNLVSELQDIIEGNSSNELIIRVSNKIGTMNRVVLFGPDHSTHPIKLTVTYTNI